MKASNIEFYGTPSGEVMIMEHGKPLRKYIEEKEYDLTSEMLEYISEFYPEAFSALAELYTQSERNRRHFEYKMVHRFIRCNFKEFDNTADIDHRGVFRFEFINCPLRGECKFDKVICQPKFDTKLSNRQLEVMQYYFNGFKANEIADKMNISITTVETHKTNSLRKLGLHSLSEFNSYAAKHHIF